MGWFITQSLAFIIVAAVLGLAIGIWIGWLVWGRRKGKHTAEKAEGTARATAASGTAGAAAGSDAESASSAEAEADADAEKVPALAVAGTEESETADVADAAGAAGTKSTTPDAGTADADAVGSPETAQGGTEAGPARKEEGEDDEAEPAGSDVVAEAEAVARQAAEANAAARAADTGTPAAQVAGAETEADAETPDDLRRIEGIGPKIAAALVAAGYPTYARIAAATEDELREAVAGQGIRFAPSAGSWADQAQYLVDSDAKGLEEYQDYLVGGQERRAKFNEKVDYTDVDEIEGADAKAAALAADEAEAAAAEATPEPEPEPEPQDLQRLEGIGPKIEAALKAAGYTTYARIAAASETELREALATSGITFAPAATSWADQAQYLADGDEDGLQEFQDYLIGGQDRRSTFSEKVDYTDVDEIEGADAKAAALAADEAKATTEGGTGAGAPA